MILLPGNRCLSKIQTHRQLSGLCATQGWGEPNRAAWLGDRLRLESERPRRQPRPHGGEKGPDPAPPAVG